MTAPLPDDLNDLEWWAVKDGRDILAGLRDRGLTVRLGEDGRPRVGPRHLVDQADLAILAANRAKVLTALSAERGDK